MSIIQVLYFLASHSRMLTQVYLLHMWCARTGYLIPGNRPLKHVREMLGFMKMEKKKIDVL